MLAPLFISHLGFAFAVHASVLLLAEQLRACLHSALKHCPFTRFVSFCSVMLLLS